MTKSISLFTAAAIAAQSVMGSHAHAQTSIHAMHISPELNTFMRKDFKMCFNNLNRGASVSVNGSHDAYGRTAVKEFATYGSVTCGREQDSHGTYCFINPMDEQFKMTIQTEPTFVDTPPASRPLQGQILETYVRVLPKNLSVERDFRIQTGFLDDIPEKETFTGQQYFNLLKREYTAGILLWLKMGQKLAAACSAIPA
jgi:hypothetical protein